VAPLESHAEFSPGRGRDPVGLLLGQAESRVPELVPVRHGRMLVSPFTFYRGAALPMAADLAGTPSSGLRVQLCGDAHLSNFGVFASPERRLVFDVNDFDETLPGPFEWDVKRLAASLAVAGRASGFPVKARRKIALAAAEGYRTAMAGFAEQPFLGSPRSPSLIRGSCSSVQGYASGFLPTPPHSDAVASGSELAPPLPPGDFHPQSIAHAGRTQGRPYRPSLRADP
jgi:hypothetical protein